jgi:rSAM/selenodomain-associated transferase 1
VESVDNQVGKDEKKAVLGIFAKNPQPGRVKTRLCPPLSPAEAAAFYTECLLETVERMRQLTCFAPVLCYAGERSWFEEMFPGMELMAQEGADLGLRMAAALETFLTRGYQKAVLIGSDSPDLPMSFMTRAFRLLDDCELVVGPALDGGYYLIGESFHHPALFERISWSSDQVLGQTLARADRLNIACGQLEPWEDLDDVAALKRYLKRNPSGRTARFARRQLARCFS